MKGLAIASFVLGILGLLFSCAFGLGILPSILAVVLGIIPLVRRVLRSMAIPGLVMGCLGVLISIAFLAQGPDDVARQAMKEIANQREAAPAKTLIELGEGIRIGELLVTFDSVQTTKSYDTGRYPMLAPQDTIKEEPKPGYKLVIVKVKAENVGKRKDGLWLSGGETQDYEIEVDKGYVYDPLLGQRILNINLLPEETGSDELVFEVLESTAPVKLHALIKGRRFTVNLQ